MKNHLFLSLIAFAFGSAALTMNLVDRASSPARSAGATGAVVFDSGDHIAARVDELIEENRVLRERLTALELQPISNSGSRAPVSAGFVSQEEFDAFRKEMHEALEGDGGGVAKLASGPAGFKDQVASTLSEIRKEESVGQVRAWQEKRLERLDEAMPKIESWLELTSTQTSKMRSAILAQYDRETELTRRWEAGEDEEVIGEVKRSDREAHLSELGGFLTPSQLERYSARGGK
ncbi:MAG: hypothetical protein ACI8QC_002277 [Planctomycetota bacterium]|jgi:hypothetical protein